MKATELLIFFLLLFTFFQIYPVQLQKQVHSVSPLIASEQQQEKGPDIETNISEDQPITQQENTIQAKTTFKETTVSNPQATRTVENNINPLPSLAVNTVAETLESRAFAEKINDTALNSIYGVQLASLISVEEISAIGSEISYVSEPNIAFSKMKLNKNLFGKSIWLNVYAGMDLDIITTPYDEVYGLNAYTQFSSSNKFGASISFYQELLEWETGLNYTHKQFQPKLLIKEISGRSSGEYAETSLQSIGFSMLQIPLQMKYHFATFKGWRSYALVGTSLNIVADAKYDVRLKILTDTPNYIGPTPVPEPKINDKEFSNGVLSNGSFYSNSYFTLNGGFGLQKGITGNTALFIEQSYQHHLFSGGIGPNMNKINNFTFVTGIKTNIY
jgi:hypothetical protein